MSFRYYTYIGTPYEHGFHVKVPCTFRQYPKGGKQFCYNIEYILRKNNSNDTLESVIHSSICEGDRLSTYNKQANFNNLTENATYSLIASLTNTTTLQTIDDLELYTFTMPQFMHSFAEIWIYLYDYTLDYSKNPKYAVDVSARSTILFSQNEYEKNSMWNIIPYITKDKIDSNENEYIILHVSENDYGNVNILQVSDGNVLIDIFQNYDPSQTYSQNATLAFDKYGQNVLWRTIHEDHSDINVFKVQSVITNGNLSSFSNDSNITFDETDITFYDIKAYSQRLHNINEHGIDQSSQPIFLDQSLQYIHWGGPPFIHLSVQQSTLKFINGDDANIISIYSDDSHGFQIANVNGDLMYPLFNIQLDAKKYSKDVNQTIPEITINGETYYQANSDEFSALSPIIYELTSNIIDDSLTLKWKPLELRDDDFSNIGIWKKNDYETEFEYIDNITISTINQYTINAGNIDIYRKNTIGIVLNSDNNPDDAYLKDVVIHFPIYKYKPSMNHTTLKFFNGVDDIVSIYSDDPDGFQLANENGELIYPLFNNKTDAERNGCDLYVVNEITINEEILSIEYL